MTSTLSVVLTGLMLGLSPHPAWLGGLPVELPEQDGAGHLSVAKLAQPDGAASKFGDMHSDEIVEFVVGILEEAESVMECLPEIDLRDPESRAHYARRQRDCTPGGLWAIRRDRWFVLIPAVRALAATGDVGKKAFLERLFEDPRVEFIGYGSMQLVIAQAWLELAHPNLRGSEAVSWARERLVRSRVGSLEWFAQQHVLSEEYRLRGWASEIRELLDDPHPAVRRRAVRFISMSGPWEDWEQSRYLDSLLDPDPGVQAVGRAISRRASGGDAWVEPLRAFLNQDDLPENARQVAERALEIRGWRAVDTPEGWVVERI